MERDYYANRPAEPFDANENPEAWSALASYAEEHLDNVFKHIAALEKEKAELKEKLADTETLRDYWKESSFDWRHKCTSRKPFKAAVKAQRQLAKAVELIRNILRVTWGEGWNYSLDWKGKAEQFLKEVEK